MKRISLFICIILSCLLITPKVDAAPTGTSEMSYQTCIAFSDVFKTIPASTGSYYYKYCYRATCSNGVYNKANMVSNSGYRCQNGNYSPYTSISSDGCKNFSGTCTTKNSTYCTRVVFIDCNKNSDGSKYEIETTRTTTTTKKRTTTTKKKTTTKRSTTRKYSTTRKRTTTKRTTKKNTTTTTRVTTTTTTTTRALSSETGIKKIVIDGEPIENPTRLEYTVEIPYGVADVSVKVTLKDENATYKVSGNIGMSDEEGQRITILVTAEDGTQATTVFNVNRYVKKSSNCNLANIYSEDYSIDFSKNTYEYTIKVAKDVKDIEIDAVASESSQLIDIKGNENLKHKSEIKIIVTAEDGTECTYVLKVRKNNNTWKYILLIIILVGVLGTSIYFFYKYMKKSKGRYKYE